MKTSRERRWRKLLPGCALLLLLEHACVQAPDASMREGDLAIQSVEAAGMNSDPGVHFLVSVVNSGVQDFAGDFVVSVKTVDEPRRHQFLSPGKGARLGVGETRTVAIPEMVEIRDQDLIFTVESERAFTAPFRDLDPSNNSFRLDR